MNFYDCFPVGNYTRIHLSWKWKYKLLLQKKILRNMNCDAQIIRIQISKNLLLIFQPSCDF